MPARFYPFFPHRHPRLYYTDAYTAHVWELARQAGDASLDYIIASLSPTDLLVQMCLQERARRTTL